MVDLTITPGNVVPGANAKFEHGRLAGETIAAGKAVAFDPATNKYMLCDNNHANAELRRARGIAVNGASLNQPLSILTAGEITIGAAVTAGTDYYASDTPGGICPQTDVGSGETVCMIGFAKSATVITVAIQFPGVTM